jgi:hypothetical protein
VGAILGLFNLPKKYANEIAKVVQINSKIEACNATEGGRATLQDRLDGLLGELLSGNPPLSGKSAVLRASSTGFIGSGPKAKPISLPHLWDSLGTLKDQVPGFMKHIDRYALTTRSSMDLT